ncbi:PIN domain-containing protein [Jiangella mangrovi]|uniref:Ribonuclease VapC n=1 Tax=Jiangella mangrovi TaxID=1524084 RepID=A0A7W9LJY8_9ACTN|nr:ribonuclease VapC [Jiangella mangrovi]
MTDGAQALVVDTSAVVAILTGENGADWLIDTLSATRHRYMASATYLELGIVLETRMGPVATGAAARFVRDSDIELVEVDPVIAERALEGWRLFGKGRHPAALNYGDCFTYGVAAELGIPVLCVGDDFARTHLEVLRPS